MNISITSVFSNLASKERVDCVMQELRTNGIDARFVETSADAKKMFFKIIPHGAEIMTMSSVTLQHTGIADEIDKSGMYNSVHKKLMSMDRVKENAEMQRIGAAPLWAAGSVHAVTEAGQVMIASATGSQLSSYASGASHIIWVVGTQKIVKDLDEGMKRIYEYSFLLENERAQKVYGMGSSVNKILIINKEFQPGRITLIFVNELLGF